jgi:5-(carboxyamino)imidazole ribonucleotide mutase
MPPGIPVATVAINGALNAGLLAAKILACTDEELSGRLEEYAASLENMVDQKAQKLEQEGYSNYLMQMN